MRDKAIQGLGTLAFREEWRKSQHDDLIVGLVKDAMKDENPVVRMSAAHAFHAVYTNIPAPERVRMLGELLQGESNTNVRNVYISLLRPEAHESPQEVDDVLRKLADEPESPTETGPTDDDTLDLPVEILTFLAMRHQTPFATETVRTWAANAPHSGGALQATHFVRDYLAPESDPAVQDRAFDMVTKAADSCLKHWTTKLEERASNTDPSESERDELKHTVTVLDSVANQMYFASGAFDHKKGDDDATASRAGQERFADLATPVLITCARSTVSGIVHHVVETLVFLAPLDDRRALLSIMEAVASDWSYAYDPLASDAVIPYLKRLLAEHRQLVLFDDEGVAAFRKLLSAFASAGNESALELAFTFSDVFR
jgi:hypothetical protein